MFAQQTAFLFGLSLSLSTSLPLSLSLSTSLSLSLSTSLSRPLSLSLSPWQEELDEWTVAFQYAISELPMLGQSAEEFNTH